MSGFDLRQIRADPLETARANEDGRQAQLHTAMPGFIVSYNAQTMTATVQPSIQGIQRMRDGTTKPVTISPIQDVPVHFPGGGGHTLTFPVAANDECLIIFSERNIDAWYQHGGVQAPLDWRMHDITDAFALVGIKSQPNVLGSGGGAPQASNDTVQLRSNDGQTVVQIDGPNQAVTVSAGNTAAVVFVDGKDQAVIVQATKNVQIQGNAGGNLGFFNATPVAKPIITGSKGGNAALTSLLQHLAQMGLVTDSTT